jgi:hypothetical protein
MLNSKTAPALCAFPSDLANGVVWVAGSFSGIFLRNEGKGGGNGFPEAGGVFGRVGDLAGW